MQFFHCQGHGRDFLHKLRSNLIRDPAASRAGHEHTRVVTINPNLGFHAFQEFERLLRLFRLVALIVLPEHLVRSCIDNNCLHSR